VNADLKREIARAVLEKQAARSGVSVDGFHMRQHAARVKNQKIIGRPPKGGRRMW
jgi:hypothetical protein